PSLTRHHLHCPPFHPSQAARSSAVHRIDRCLALMVGY
uniref:Uncharacterized protein n=1 Tax=Aegilops tauschii subsp. strangulata TaxID=200361 RepID=A0A453QAK2_AEGTS